MGTAEKDRKATGAMQPESVQNSSKTPVIERPFMLFEVLMAEYRALGILNEAEIKEINKYRIERGKFHGIIPFLEAEAKEDKERRKQFELRHIRRVEVMKKLRDVLHRSPILSVADQEDKSGGAGGKKGQAENMRQDAVSNSITAICLSGGGIRSATFCLGVIQGLASLGLLGKFHYLSTVSGGGFIGSWLSAWIYRNRVEKAKALGADLILPKPGERLDESSVIDIQENLKMHRPEMPEPPEVTHLRKYSNYMSPTVGLFSTDTWALIAVYLRNLLLNWTVIIPLLVAILLLPKLVVSWMGLSLDGYFLVYGSIVAVLFGWVAIGSINMMRPSLKNYSPFAQSYMTDEIGTVRPANKIALFCIAPLLVFVTILATLGSWAPDAVGKIELIYYIGFGALVFFGGYLAGWLVMLKNFADYWRRKREEGSGRPLEPELRCEEPNTGVAARAWDAVKHFFKTYLSESIFSLVSGGIGGAILYLVVKKIFPAINGMIGGLGIAEFYACFGVPLVLTVFLLTATIFTGLAVRITNDDDREWVTRFGALILKIVFGWTLISTAVILGPRLFMLGNIGDSPFVKTAALIIGSLSGLFSVFAGFSSKTPAKKDEPSKSWSGFLLKIGSSIAAPIAVLMLVILISKGTSWLTSYGIFSGSFNQTKWFAIFTAIGCLMGFFININKFSFHSTYRDRLIRAYLGASNRNRLSEANSFTGLDTEADNVELVKLRHKPLHVLNMTLNMVKSDNLAWQNRKAESFTATTFYAGSSQMGESGNYRGSECYGFNKQNQTSMTLGTSAAISGAAVSPNMGYYTQSTAVSFLMVLLNVRLGWWLGNPGQRGKWLSAWKKPAPLWSPLAFFSEAFLQTDDTHSYVYLADGGQFENLGLYEMVLRRCKTILVCDAGADPVPAFFDLGSAIHKIRVDLGIPIEFESGMEPATGKYGAVAKIRYSEVDGSIADDGTLIYIKPTLTGSEPIDIEHYKKENPAFPHETTADQFYSETQFESYRSLGFHMMETVGKGLAGKSAADLVHSVRSNVGRESGETGRPVEKVPLR